VLCLAAGNLSAADKVLSFSTPITPPYPMINAGIGIGSHAGLSMSVPPLMLTADIPVDVGIPLSFGLGLGYVSFGDIFMKLSFLDISARVALHFNLGVPGLDVYPLLTLGPVICWWSEEIDYFFYKSTESWSETIFGFGFAGGIRYYFNDNVGIWAELGYSNLSIVAAGVTFTFGGGSGGGGGGGSSSGRRAAQAESSQPATRRSKAARHMVVNADPLNVRSGPSSEHALVGQLKRNTRVEVLDSSGKWWKIRAGSVEGYVNSSLLAEEN